MAYLNVLSRYWIEESCRKIKSVQRANKYMFCYTKLLAEITVESTVELVNFSSAMLLLSETRDTS